MNRLLRSVASQFSLLNRPARLFLLALFFDGLFFSGWQLFFNLYIVSAGYSRDFLGLVNAAPSLAALVLGVPMGLLSDRLGRKRAMITGFSLANVAIIAMTLVRSELLLFLFSAALGVTAQLYILSQAPFMMKVSDDRSRDVLFSWSYGMFPLASTLGNFIAGYLPDAFTTWFHLNSQTDAYRSVLLFSVISSFIVLIPLSLIREPVTSSKTGETQQTAGRESTWKVLLRPLTIKLSLPNLLIGLGAAILVPYFNVFFAERHQMSDSALGLLFSIGSLVMGVACLIGPRLVGNLGGKIRTIVIGETASLVFQLAIGFSPWLWLAAIGFLVRGALMNMVAPLFDAYAMERTAESEHGAVNSVRYMAWNIGWAVGPYLSGLVQQRWGFTPLFIATAVLYAVGILLTWIFFRPARQQLVHPAG